MSHLNKSILTEEEHISLLRISLPTNRQQIKQFIQTMRQIQTTDDWREHGKVRRRQLLEKDALEGSMNFSLSEDCSVSMYFKVADRVRNNTMHHIMVHYTIDKYSDDFPVTIGLGTILQHVQKPNQHRGNVRQRASPSRIFKFSTTATPRV